MAVGGRWSQATPVTFVVGGTGNLTGQPEAPHVCIGNPTACLHPLPASPCFDTAGGGRPTWQFVRVRARESAVSTTVDGAPASLQDSAPPLHAPVVSTRWARAELAVSAARGAIAGYMIYLALSNLSGDASDSFVSGYAVDSVGDLLLLWLPIILMYLAGSARVLSWASEKLGAKVSAVRSSGWLAGQRLYLGWLSARALAMLAVIVLVQVAWHHSSPKADQSSMAGAGGILAGLITWTWAAGMRKSPKATMLYGALVGGIGAMIWAYIHMKYLSGLTHMVDLSEFGMTVNLSDAAVTPGNIISDGVVWAAYGLAGGYALTVMSREISLAVRLVLAMTAVGIVASILPFGHLSMPWYFLPGIAWAIAVARARSQEIMT